MPDQPETRVTHLSLISGEQLTLADRRFYNCLLAHALNHLLKKCSFSINLQDLDNVYGYGTANINDIKQSLRRLAKTFIELRIIQEDSEIFAITPLLDFAEYSHNQKSLSYSFAKECSKLLAVPEYFEKHIIQAHFAYKYSSLLYDMLSGAYFSNQFEYSIKIEELRHNLGINQDKFINYNDFKRYVLEPSLKEINAHASFTVLFGTKSKGRKIIQVDFKLTKKQFEHQHFHAAQTVSRELQQLFRDNPKLLEAYTYLVNAKTEERERLFAIAIKIGLAKNMIFRDEEVDNPEAWFLLIMDEILKKL